MAVTLTHEQGKTDAASLCATANRLDPPATTPTAPPATPSATEPGSGGTVITPGAFPGRSTPGSEWKSTPLFEDNFPIVVPEGGAFLSRYSRWSAYPCHFQVTNKRGFYEPNLLLVKDLGDGQTVLNCRLVLGSNYSDGMSRSTAAYPRFPGQNDAQHLNLRWEQRVRVVKKVPKWHAANLGWPIKDGEWPDRGENDYMEIQLDGSLGAFFHISSTAAAVAKVQIKFSAPGVDITLWFTVGFELIAGKSYKWLVNGKQVGDTVPSSKVPNYPQRIVLQVVEDVANDFNLPIDGQDPEPGTRQRDRFSHDRRLFHALLMLTYGHVTFEQVYRFDERIQRFRLRKLAPRMPGTISEIQIARRPGIHPPVPIG
jgi:hypothetical protein